MKATKLVTMRKNIFFTIATAIMIFSISSCATKAPFLTSQIVPAARGTVTIKNDKNKNFVIKIKISNLAEVERLQPPKNTYVVWMDTEDNITKNIGQIKSSTTILSKKLTASFGTISSLRPTKIFITAEYDASSQNPGSEVILSTDNF